MEKQWLWNQDHNYTIRGSGAQHTAISICSEAWPMTAAKGKKLDAAHNEWFRRILHTCISLRDKITNKSVWEKTGQEDVGRCIRRRRLDGTRGEDEGSKTGCAVCRPWTRVRKGSVEEAHRERPGRKLDMKKSVAWIRRVERRSSWRRTEMDGVTVSPDVKTCTGRTKY